MTKEGSSHRKIYGRLTITSEPYKKSDGKYIRTYVLTVCRCGVKKEIRLSHIKAGAIQSCGCFRNEQNLVRSITHGLSYHPLYGVWNGMKERCYNKNSERYMDYGGIGVEVCKEWKDDFKAFYDWAIDKWRPGLSLDKDKLAPNKTGKLYCPKYCCFLTTEENNRNKRNTLSLSQVEEIRNLYLTGTFTYKSIGNLYGVGDTTICAIINKRNWS